MQEVYWVFHQQFPQSANWLKNTNAPSETGKASTGNIADEKGSGGQVRLR